MKLKQLQTDILIIGGGAAGCYAAITLGEQSAAQVLIAEKAGIRRSGCLAAGVNALNAYITKGQTAHSYLEYARRDADGIIRDDLVYTMAERLNAAAEKLEQLGLVILKDENGDYAARGPRNIKINGENIKPLLADAAMRQKNVTVLHRVNITDYIVHDGRVTGAYGFSVEEDTAYVLSAKAVICATGGASGLYRPNNPGFSRHKLWYSPFNTGAGYAMGIRAGAEMTTFEMRFIALRCKDTIAPTGTIAQGVGAQQVNSRGEAYEARYGGPKTSVRLYSTVMENQKGNGPCYLQTEGIGQAAAEDLLKAYLNMAPAQTLRWLEGGRTPAEENVEIEGTEPYIVGGHTASGYWVDTRRAATLSGLFAAGDVAGGCPQKYVTGALAEGEIAAQSALAYIRTAPDAPAPEGAHYLARLTGFQSGAAPRFTAEALEEAMQKTMDTYAGGIGAGYATNEAGLAIAARRIEELLDLSEGLRADTPHALLFIFELIDRLWVCKVLIEHLRARKETRWHSFHENRDYPAQDDANWLCFVNSRFADGKLTIRTRPLTKEDDIYEHSN